MKQVQMSHTYPSNEEINDPFEILKNLLCTDLKIIDDIIQERLQADVPLIPKLAGHLIHGGGKRIRPILTLASHRILHGNDPRVHLLATAAEFIHTATLLHDDVIDESTLRRGLPTANSCWGNGASVLVGDFLFARSFQLMVETKESEWLGVLADAAASMTQGEVLQLTRNQSLEVTKEELLQIIQSKTAALFAAACHMGALSAGDQGDQEAALLLRDYGMALGMVFQIADDILDYQGQEENLGKKIGDDFREGKVTLPVYFAYHNGTPEEKSFWHRTMQNLEQTPEDLKEAIRLIHQHHALRDCFHLAEEYKQKALHSLCAFPQSPFREALKGLVEHLIARKK